MWELIDVMITIIKISISKEKHKVYLLTRGREREVMGVIRDFSSLWWYRWRWRIYPVGEIETKQAGQEDLNGINQVWEIQAERGKLRLMKRWLSVSCLMIDARWRQSDEEWPTSSSAICFHKSEDRETQPVAGSMPAPLFPRRYSESRYLCLSFKNQGEISVSWTLKPRTRWEEMI